MSTAYRNTFLATGELLQKYQSRIEVNSTLSRALVSYQSNRQRPEYRWFKYKEGFSAALVEYFLEKLKVTSGSLIDPFAGSGASLFVAAERGLSALGLELLPVGIRVIEARLAARRVNPKQLSQAIKKILQGDWKVSPDKTLSFQHLRTTHGAFSAETEKALVQFRTYLRDNVKDSDIRLVLEFAMFSILESISFTRKDGQYLRWDYRAPRNLPGKKFDKGTILPFETALLARLAEIAHDLEAQDLWSADEISNFSAKKIELQQGSCHDILPLQKKSSHDLLITSPPYCNRYDYTRTYALELAFLGTNEEELKSLRQRLLSCTVENKSKREALTHLYAGLRRGKDFQRALDAFENQTALQENLEYLQTKAELGELNNPQIVRMVENYFLESAITIFEWARIIKSGGSVVMVNDNVQYGGREIPVDLILCHFAEQAGFEVQAIWTLPRGKGNSSQQMGEHGRNELRKCVYVWKKG
jgi:DNA modification methylase